MRTFKPKSIDYSAAAYGYGEPPVTRSRSASKHGKRSSHHQQPQRSNSHYASSPHLFVFQGDEDEYEAAGATSALAAAPFTTPGIPHSVTDYHIYSSTHEIRDEKSAIRKITEKYDSLKRLTERAASLDLGNGTCDVEDEDDGLTLRERDINRIEAFFRGLKTSVFVCRSLANLYIGSIESRHSNRGWGERKYTGVPLLLLDCGQTRSRDRRQLQIVLAEKESGFTLWREVIDNLTDYRASTETFHTMYASKNHRVMIGLSFDSGDAAHEFLAKIEELTSNPANISLSGPGRRGKKNLLRSASSDKKKPEKYKPPKKCDISTPCFFQHITKLGSSDHGQLYTLQAYVSGGSSNSSTAGSSDV